MLINIYNFEFMFFITMHFLLAANVVSLLAFETRDTFQRHTQRQNTVFPLVENCKLFRSEFRYFLLTNHHKE